MADFHQTGVIATFHKLGNAKLEKIEAELSWYSQERPIALVLPSLYSELEGEALKDIIRELKNVCQHVSALLPGEVIHKDNLPSDIRECKPSSDSGDAGTGPIDHLAFEAIGLKEMVTRLEEQAITVRHRKVPDLGLHQVFIQDPNGVTIVIV